jgi:hypothetical protein
VKENGIEGTFGWLQAPATTNATALMAVAFACPRKLRFSRCCSTQTAHNVVFWGLFPDGRPYTRNPVVATDVCAEARGLPDRHGSPAHSAVPTITGNEPMHRGGACSSLLNGNKALSSDQAGTPERLARSHTRTHAELTQQCHHRAPVGKGRLE